MADEDQPDADAAEAARETDRWQDALKDRSRDFLLGGLVDFVERFNVGFDITLMVSGTIVSGTMISGAAYIDELLQGMKGAQIASKPDESGLSEAIAKWFDWYRGLYEKPADAGKEYNPPPRYYLHLRNVNISSGRAKFEYSQVANWRCKLREIDAFTLVKTRID